MIRTGFDIWQYWHRMSTIILNNNQPVWDGNIWVYIPKKGEVNQEAIQKFIRRKLDKTGFYSFREDYLINCLLDAATVNKCSVKILGLSKNVISISTFEIEPRTNLFYQLSSLLNYVTDKITLPMLLSNFKGQSVYYLEPNLENEKNKKLFVKGANNNNYFPIFLEEMRLIEFYQKRKKISINIASTTFETFIIDVKTKSPYKENALVIEPLSACPVFLPVRLKIKKK